MVSSLSQALCGWSCCSGGSPTAVDPFGTHLDLSDDEKWQARALVDAVMPFVPKRVLNAFVECEFNSFASGEPKASPQIPREVEAAVLLVSRWGGLSSLSGSPGRYFMRAMQSVLP